MRNIYAVTETTSISFPGYISINEDDVTGIVKITVREPGYSGTKIATLEINDNQLLHMSIRINQYLKDKKQQTLLDKIKTFLGYGA